MKLYQAYSKSLLTDIQQEVRVPDRWITASILSQDSFDIASIRVVVSVQTDFSVRTFFSSSGRFGPNWKLRSGLLQAGRSDQFLPVTWQQQH